MESNIAKSEFINNTLSSIKRSIEGDIFLDVETAKIELKDLSTGNEWKSLKESICAFLNTDGGIAICGVRERGKKYEFKGFDRNNESKVIDLQLSTFRNDEGIELDLSKYIYFDYQSVTVENQTKDIVIIAVYPLSDDLKYVSYNGEYFERKLTQDKKIPEAKIQQQREYKLDLEYAKEIAVIQGATNKVTITLKFLMN